MGSTHSRKVRCIKQEEEKEEMEEEEEEGGHRNLKLNLGFEIQLADE